MMRLRFILGLILLGVSLQFIAKTLSGVLPMMKEAALYPASGRVVQLPFKQQTRIPTPHHHFSTLQRFKRLFPKEKLVKLVTPADETLPLPKDSGNAFMQITIEELRPPIKNTSLGKEGAAQVEAFLLQKQKDNTLLADETGALFGEEVKKEIIYILTQDEKDSLTNARKSKTAQEYFQRQEKTDRNTSKKLAEVFEKHKKQFNRRLYENSPEWNAFFKRVNAFQKAAD